MKSSLFAGLALVTSTSRCVLASGGRHSVSNNKMRHVVRSSWGTDQSPQTPSPGYASCVQQCMAGLDPLPMSPSTGDVSAPAYTQNGYGSAVSSVAVSTMTTVPGAGANGSLPDTSPMMASMSAGPSMVPGGGGGGYGYGYGSPPPVSPANSSSPPTNATATAPLVPGPYQVVVAPKKGDLRMVPFNIEVPPGQNVTFVWGAGPHTVTRSSALEICNATKADGAFKSGMQDVGFQFPVQVSSNATQFYFCGVPLHCQKGMFGLINGLEIGGAEGSLGQAMPQMAANDTGLMSLYNETKAICKDSPSAWAWGNKLAISQFPEWALPTAMENVLYTRAFLATNPPGLLNSSTPLPLSPVPSGAGTATPSQSTSQDSNDASRSTFLGGSVALSLGSLAILSFAI